MITDTNGEKESQTVIGEQQLLIKMLPVVRFSNESAFTFIFSLFIPFLSAKRYCQMPNAEYQRRQTTEKTKTRRYYGIETQWKVINFINGFAQQNRFAFTPVCWLLTVCYLEIVYVQMHQIRSHLRLHIFWMLHWRTLPLPFRCDAMRFALLLCSDLICEQGESTPAA